MISDNDIKLLIDSNIESSNLLINEIKKTKINKNKKKENKELAINSKHQSKFIHYFKERQNFYKSINYPTPILDKIRKENIRIGYNLFTINKPKDKLIVEPFYPNMKKLIDAFNYQIDFDEEIIGRKNIGYVRYQKDNITIYILKELFQLLIIQLFLKKFQIKKNLKEITFIILMKK